METEAAIRKLLVEAGADLSPDWSDAALDDRQMQADFKRIDTRETYLGWKRAKNFASTGGFAKNDLKLYETPTLADNEWALAGSWQVEEYFALAGELDPVLSINFSARDANLVLGSIDGRSKQARLLLDGAPPGADAGVDVAPDGRFTIEDQRVYQLVRQRDGARRRLLTIELEDGTTAYAFTFG